MKRLFIRILIVILSIMVVHSCDKKYDVLGYYPLEVHTLSAEEQSFILETEGDVFEIWFNYGEGDSDIFDTMNGVEHGSAGLYVSYYDGGWFKADARENPRRLVISLDENRGATCRSIEIYVDVFGPEGHHPGKHIFNGTGYHIILTQNPSGK